MTEKFKRQPFKHFFIMDRVQKSFITKIMVIVCGVSLLTLLVVATMYYLKYHSGYFYFMTESLDEDLIRHSIWSLILPSAGPSLIASILVGVFVALYGSRKIALPLFKIKQWATSMFAGNLDYEVTLRSGDDLFELETSCKQVSKKYNEIFHEIKELLDNQDKSSDEKVQGLREYISEFKMG